MFLTFNRCCCPVRNHFWLESVEWLVIEVMNFKLQGTMYTCGSKMFWLKMLGYVFMHYR